MGFKGTRGKWEYLYDGNDYCYDIVSDYGLICSTMSAGIKDRYNALLISNAPEMLEEIQDTIDELKLLKSTILDASKINNRLQDIVEVIQNWIDRKEQLIKEATEL